VPGADFDGDEFREGFATIYIYGRSADKLFDALSSAIRPVKAPTSSYLIRRYGPPGSRQKKIQLGETPTGSPTKARPS